MTSQPSKSGTPLPSLRPSCIDGYVPHPCEALREAWAELDRLRAAEAAAQRTGEEESICASIADCVAAAHRNSGMPNPEFKDWKLDTIRESIWQLSYEINRLRPRKGAEGFMIEQWNRRATAPTSAREVAELTTSFVQCVPDKCDRITWRGHYYHLPLQIPAASLPSAAEQRAEPKTLTSAMVPKEIRNAEELEAAYQEACRGRHYSEIAPILALRNACLPIFYPQPVAPPAAGAEVANVIANLKDWEARDDDLLIRHARETLESLSAQAEALRLERDDANYWRKRHCDDSVARGKQSHEHWLAWKAAEQRASSLQAELDAVKKSRDIGVTEVLRLAEELRKRDPSWGSPMHLNAARAKEPK